MIPIHPYYAFVVLDWLPLRGQPLLARQNGLDLRTMTEIAGSVGEPERRVIVVPEEMPAAPIPDQPKPPENEPAEPEKVPA